MKELFLLNIYPTKEEFFHATEYCLAEKHANFFKSLSEQRWIFRYECKIKQDVILEQFYLIVLFI